ncbi:MAG: hypothetical protein ACXVPN_09935 [Bacteroidia bacterium]
MPDKKSVYAACCGLLKENISSLKKFIRELEEGSENDTKSSAGDKHETARAMLQLEQEKLSKQLHNSQLLLADLEKTGVVPAAEIIGKGSLVTTNQGVFLFGPPLGKIIVDGLPVVCLSPQSPLGIKLCGLKINGAAEINGLKYIIENVE